MELPRYKMERSPRGMCLIFNQVEFKDALRLPTRHGSDDDEKRAAKRFRSLGFSVTIHKNFTLKEWRSTMKDAAKPEHHTNSDCFACLIMSHGENSMVYGTDGLISIDELLGFFRGDQCDSLVGKPKLFFIQACLGDKEDYGVSYVGAGEGGVTLIDEEDVLMAKIPVEADFFIAYSTIPGYVSWLDKNDGSIFIVNLCKVLKQRGTQLEIHHLLVLVNEQIAIRFEVRGMKQMPSMHSMLTKQLYF